MHIVNVGYDSTNFYVLGQGHQRLLIDVGWPGTFPKLLASLRRKDIPLQDIRYLLVTHYHPDHAGLAQEVKTKGVRLIVLRQQLPALPLLKTHMKPINHYVEVTLNDNFQLTTAESRAFLQRLGIEGEIVSTPGHSDDSVTLVLDEGIAFTGDLTNPAATEDTSDTLLTQSWNRLRALGVTHIYPGHGPVWPL